MLTARLLILFLHVTAVIVALGGSLFSTFVLTPILAEELDPAPRVKVARQLLRRLGVIVLSALLVLVLTGLVNLLYLGAWGPVLMLKLALVLIVIGLTGYQYCALGVRIWKISANGPHPELPVLHARFRRVGITVGSRVLLIVYMSLALTRAPGALTIAPPP